MTQRKPPWHGEHAEPLACRKVPGGQLKHCNWRASPRGPRLQGAGHPAKIAKLLEKTKITMVDDTYYIT